ncbi:MAG: hypothetical protein JO314_04130 [Acidobacteria bacterium]|nr:hypothetical protein [Acidobacteriota bacterium]
MENEDSRATELLNGKVVRRVIRHRPQEVLIEFSDGTRFYIDSDTEILDLSITDGPNGD